VSRGSGGERWGKRHQEPRYSRLPNATGCPHPLYQYIKLHHCYSPRIDPLGISASSSHIFHFRHQLNMAPKNDIPAYVLGVGLTKFIKPRQTRAYPEMGYEAGVKAMLDAQINYDDVETGVACYCYGDTTSGQRVFYQFGMSS
jgi:hypothetical protein